MFCHVTIAITFEAPQRPWNILFYTEQHATKFDLTREVSRSYCRNTDLDSVHLRGVFTFVSETSHGLNPLPCKACQNVISRDIQGHVINNASCTYWFTWTSCDLDRNYTICQLRAIEKRCRLLHTAFTIRFPLLNGEQALYEPIHFKTFMDIHRVISFQYSA